MENGLRVVSAPRAGAESVAIGIWINAGGRYETRALNGISHFLEHLLFKGTRRRTSRQIKEAIEGRGGVLNAFTDEEFTCVWAKVRPKELDSTVEVLTDMVLASRLDRREIEKERSVVVEEIRMYEDLPMQYVHDLLNTLLWPNHPLGMVLSGTEESVRRIGRSDLASYQRRFYTPRNICVAAAGHLSHRRLVEAVGRWWGRVPPGRQQTCSRVRQQQRKPRVRVEKKETEQTHLSLGFHAFPRNHPQVQALNLLNVILGGNMSSRLFQQVREERGLCYEIGSQVKRYRDTGLFSVSAGVEHGKLLKCLKVVVQELKRLKSEPVGSKEFDLAIEYFTGSLLFSLEETVDQMCWVGECEMLLRRVEPVEAILEQMGRVRRSDLTKVAREILRPDHMNLAVIGPMKSATSTRIGQLLES